MELYVEICVTWQGRCFITEVALFFFVFVFLQGDMDKRSSIDQFNSEYIKYCCLVKAVPVSEV